MTRREQYQATAAFLLLGLSACGREPTPTGPSGSRSFLEGVWTGTVTIEQESLESSLLTGTANLTIVSPSGNTPLNGVPLNNAGVDLGGNVAFTLEQGNISWVFTGEKAGDILSGTHTLTQGSETRTGTWTGER